MFVDYRGSVLGLLGWQYKPLIAFVIISSLVVAGQRFLPGWVIGMAQLPALPLGVVGGAIGIFVSFRTNSAYDRWWEGRKLWGRLVNSSRMFATQVLSYLPREGAAPSATQARLVRRQILYVHTLRCLLRLEDPFADTDVAAFVGDEGGDYAGQSNPTHAILQRHADDLAAAAREGAIDPFRLQSFDGTIAELLDIQGGCERIKKTPFPRGYGFIAERLIIAYGFLLPFGLVEALGWVTVPMTVLVCMSFLLISEVGRVLEDPFTNFWPALPLSALAKTIEINLRDRLGETELPPLPKPNERGILM
jgi:ion channel-forming bestrophin family protein